MKINYCQLASGKPNVDSVLTPIARIATADELASMLGIKRSVTAGPLAHLGISCDVTGSLKAGGFPYDAAAYLAADR